MARPASSTILRALRAGWFALLLCLVPAIVAAQSLPALTSRVVDNADMIEAAAEQALTEKLAAFEQKSSDQIVVATVPSLGGEAIEPYANRLFRAWELGQAGDDNGVLLLVARDDRKMRIEVGYGLEGTLTDLHASLIIDEMVPAFRAGDFAEGIARAVDDIILVLEGNAAELEARAERNRQQAGELPWEFFLVFALVIPFILGIFAFIGLASIYGKKIAPGHYKWLGMDFYYGTSGQGGYRGSSGSGWSSGGFSGGGGSSGGGGASGGW